MKRFLTALRDGSLVSVVVFIALLLVASSILKSLDMSLHDLWKSYSPVQSTTARSDEVQNYTLFTEVAYGQHKVMTGTQYESTTNKVIEKQWCYLSEAGSQGTSMQLNLAGKDKAGQLLVFSFLPKGLAKFNLTAAGAKSLIKTHCRFQ